MTSRPAPTGRRRTGQVSRALCITLGVLILHLAAAVATAPAADAQNLATPPTLGAQYRDGQTNRYLLGGVWQYRADQAGVGVADGWWRTTPWTTDFVTTSVPNSFNAGDLSNASMNGYIGWYRRDFTLPANPFPKYVPQADRSWLVEFDSVNYNATVWLNGRELGTHSIAYLPFYFAMTGLHAGVNSLIVRVDNQRTPTDLPPGPGGGWWNYGGILQEVYMVPIARGVISQVMVRPNLPCPTCAATVQEQAVITNPTKVPQELSLSGTYGGAKVNFGADVIPPGGSWTATATVPITHPKLWSIDSPNLYQAKLTLADSNGRALTHYFTYSGIRSIVRASDGRLLLNGRLLDLRGFAIHEQTLTTGAALTPANMRQIISWIRELGGHLIRCHYPLNPYLLQLADQYGILVWSEIPVYQVSSQYLDQPAWLAQAYATLKENIVVNQNHPSILVWSIANELRTPPDSNEAVYIRGAAALAKKLDPTRPVGIAITDSLTQQCQTAYAPLDVIGFNDYFGWFSGGGDPVEDRDAFGPFLDLFRSCYPTQALFVTEFGVDANRAGPVEVRGTYAFQTDTDLYDLGVMASKPWLSGATYFTLQDFAARPGWAGGNPLGDPPFVQKGLVDLYGNAKPAFGPVGSVYRSTVQIAPASEAASKRSR